MVIDPLLAARQILALRLSKALSAGSLEGSDTLNSLLIKVIKSNLHD